MKRILAVDLGERRDYTAWLVLDEVGEDLRRYPDDRGVATFYDVVHIDRCVHIQYPQIVERTFALMNTPELRGAAELVVDATGVGVPVVEMMQARGLSPYAIWIKSAGRPAADRELGGYTVSKRDLAMAADLVLQSRRLRIHPALPYRDQLRKELQAFTRDVTNGGETYEAAREDGHGDIVMAACMALWKFTQGGLRTVDRADRGFEDDLGGRRCDVSPDWNPLTF